MEYGDEIWKPRPDKLRLPTEGELDVWRISLISQSVQARRDVLTTDELLRADRFHFRADRDRFTITRGILRTLLGEYALMVFGIAIDVGIDIEFLGSQTNAMELADLILSPSEKLYFRNIPEEARAKALLRIWTRKEALTKALGAGLSIPLSSFEDMAPAGEDRRFTAGGKSMTSSEWSVRDLPAGDHYVAAVAAKSQNIRVRLWNWR